MADQGMPDADSLPLAGSSAYNNAKGDAQREQNPAAQLAQKPLKGTPETLAGANPTAFDMHSNQVTPLSTGLVPGNWPLFSNSVCTSPTPLRDGTMQIAYQRQASHSPSEILGQTTPETSRSDVPISDSAADTIDPYFLSNTTGLHAPPANVASSRSDAPVPAANAVHTSIFGNAAVQQPSVNGNGRKGPFNASTAGARSSKRRRLEKYVGGVSSDMCNFKRNRTHGNCMCQPSGRVWAAEMDNSTPEDRIRERDEWLREFAAGKRRSFDSPPPRRANPDFGLSNPSSSPANPASGLTGWVDNIAEFTMPGWTEAAMFERAKELSLMVTGHGDDAAAPGSSSQPPTAARNVGPDTRGEGGDTRGVTPEPVREEELFKSRARNEDEYE